MIRAIKTISALDPVSSGTSNRHDRDMEQNCSPPSLGSSLGLKILHGSKSFRSCFGFGFLSRVRQDALLVLSLRCSSEALRSGLSLGLLGRVVKGVGLAPCTALVTLLSGRAALPTATAEATSASLATSGIVVLVLGTVLILTLCASFAVGIGSFATSLRCTLLRQRGVEALS